MKKFPKDATINRFWIAAFAFFAPCLSFGFYNLAGGIPYRYSIKFEGSVIVSNSYRAQTNKQASFTFDFSIGLNDETEKLSEQVINWRFGPIKNDKTLPLFAKLWENAISQSTNTLAYSIMLPSDQILTISKDGTRSSLGTLLEIVFPVINFTNRSKLESYTYQRTNALGGVQNLEMRLTAWDFFGQEPPEDAGPVAFIMGRDEIISAIYTDYEEKNKLKQPTLFWMQNTSVFFQDSLGIARPSMNFTGVYQINLRRGILEKVHALAQASFYSPLKVRGSTVNWGVEINGIFTLEETL